MEALGIARGNVHIASHTECFVYYVLNQRRDVWGGQVGMFSLSDEDLRYYELKVTRGPRRMTAIAEHEELEEASASAFSIQAPGQRWQTRSCAPAESGFYRKRSFLDLPDGKGFARTDWRRNL